MINLIDLLIIYLASGAPFGVYYFLMHRTQTASPLIWVKSIVNFLFWMPLGFVILRRHLNFNAYLHRRRVAGMDEAEVVRETNIGLIQKRIETIYAGSDLKISIYEFREITERYIGLTLAEKVDGQEVANHEKEFYRISNANHVELGSICLQRRNRKQLSAHQTLAREDFLRLAYQLKECGFATSELKDLLTSLTTLIEDLQAQQQIEQMFTNSLQIKDRAVVQKLELDLWKPELRRPSPAKQTSALPIMNRAAMSLRRKD